MPSAKSFRQRINRLDQWQCGKTGFVHDTVGVHHLQHAVVKFGSARDVTYFALRQQLFQIVTTGVEIGQCDVAGVIARVDPIRRTRAARRSGAVFAYRDCDSNHLAGLYVTQLGPRPAINYTRRQVEQQIDHTRSLAIEQPRVKLFELRPDPGQAGE